MRSLPFAACSGAPRRLPGRYKSLAKFVERAEATLAPMIIYLRDLQSNGLLERRR